MSAMSVLRGEDYDPKQELNEMQKEAEASAGKKPSLSDMAKDPVNKKAMIASFGMMFFQQASGVNAVIFYTVMIFEASGSSMAPELASILVALVQVCSLSRISSVDLRIVRLFGNCKYGSRDLQRTEKKGFRRVNPVVRRDPIPVSCERLP